MISLISEKKVPVDAEGKGKQSGLAPSMPNCPANLSGQNSDIIHHLYGQCRGTAILHQMVWDRVIAEYNMPADPGDPGDPRDDNDPDEDDQSSHRGRHNPPRGGHPGGEGSPGERRPGGEGPPRGGPPEDPDEDDADENDDKGDKGDGNDDEDDEDRINIPAHTLAHHIIPRQGAPYNYLREFTPRNTAIGIICKIDMHNRLTNKLVNNQAH